jgi:hypothetical protein
MRLDGRRLALSEAHLSAGAEHTLRALSFWLHPCALRVRLGAAVCPVASVDCLFLLVQSEHVLEDLSETLLLKDLLRRPVAGLASKADVF